MSLIDYSVEQISFITEEEFKTYSPADVAALPEDKFTAIKGAHIKLLPDAHFKELRHKIAWFTFGNPPVTQAENVDPERIKNLDENQFALFGPQQLPHLDLSQVTDAQLKKMTPEQVEELTPAVVLALANRPDGNKLLLFTAEQFSRISVAALRQLPAA